MLTADETEAIALDLMRKIADDVTAAMCRTLAINKKGRRDLPVVMAGLGAALGVAAAALNTDKEATEPDPECILLAALLGARFGIGEADPVKAAYRDFETLRATLDAGRQALEE